MDLFLVADKGPAKRDLAALRTTICQTFIEHDFRMSRCLTPSEIERRATIPKRFETGMLRACRRMRRSSTNSYLLAAPWDSWSGVTRRSTTARSGWRRVCRIMGIDVELRVVPGISSLQLLAARHQIALNRIGGSVHVTTGRRLIEEYSPASG